LGRGARFGTETKLGRLVPFEGQIRKPAAPRPEGNEGAQILLFTGVRYERDHSTAPIKPSSSTGGKRKGG